MLNYNKYANGGSLDDRLVAPDFVEGILAMKADVQKMLENNISENIIIKINKGYTAAEKEITRAFFYDIDRVTIQEE